MGKKRADLQSIETYSLLVCGRALTAPLRIVETLMEYERNTPRAGWRLSQYCEATGLSRSYIYALSKEQQPRSIKIGKRRVITEAPADWLQRIGAANQ